MTARRVLLALYVAVAAALALVTYLAGEARIAPLYALVAWELPLSLLLAVVLWVFAYAVGVVAPDAAPAVVTAAAIALWTLGAVANVFVVRAAVRAFDRMTTGAAGP